MNFDGAYRDRTGDLRLANTRNGSGYGIGFESNDNTIEHNVAANNETALGAAMCEAS